MQFNVFTISHDYLSKSVWTTRLIIQVGLDQWHSGYCILSSIQQVASLSLTMCIVFFTLLLFCRPRGEAFLIRDIYSSYHLQNMQMKNDAKLGTEQGCCICL
jgi:hypothetical protein